MRSTGHDASARPGATADTFNKAGKPTMGEAKRRKLVRERGPQRGTDADVVCAFLDGTVLYNAPEAPMVAVGPLVWGINPTDGRRWYFICASADAAGEFHLDCLTIKNDDREWAERTRLALLAELVNRRPIIINDFDDEVRFAAFCAGVWPSERTRKIHADIKADYASRDPSKENF
jgi:hypothetical protein